jgi:hypothetical protein
MAIQNADLAPLTVLLSPERLGRLVQLTGNTKDAIELHQETLAVGTSLMGIIATIEIAIRNAVCENLSQHFNAPNWLITPPAPFRWKDDEKGKGAKAKDSAQRAEYSKLDQQQKAALDVQAFPNGRPANLSHMARAKKRRTQIHVSDGKIIAEITLHFWKRLYGPDYEHTLWKTSLKKTFPHKSVKRADVAAHLENIYQARNRLAHHEPVLHNRFTETMDSIEYIIQRLETSAIGPNTPLANLLAEPIANVSVQAQALHAKLQSYRT